MLPKLLLCRAILRPPRKNVLCLTKKTCNDKGPPEVDQAASLHYSLISYLFQFKCQLTRASQNSLTSFQKAIAKGLAPFALDFIWFKHGLKNPCFTLPSVGVQL